MTPCHPRATTTDSFFFSTTTPPLHPHKKLMSKTTWFVIIACLSVLGINAFMQDDPPPSSDSATASSGQVQQAEAAPQAATDPQQPAPAQQQQTVPAPLPGPPTPEIIATLTSKDAEGNAAATYEFRNIGGSIARVRMHGKAINSMDETLREQDVHINNAEQGIGTLMYGVSEEKAPQFDRICYKLEKQDERSVTLVGEARGFTIRKTYTLKPLEQGENIIDGNAYVIHLDVVFRNTGKLEQKFDNWALYAGGVCELPNDSFFTGGFVSYLTEADGDFEKEDTGTFSHTFSKDEVRRYDRSLSDLDWAGLMNQYYATAVKPDDTANGGSVYAAPVRLRQDGTGNRESGIELGIGIKSFSVHPEGSPEGSAYHKLAYDIFTGPKRNVMLNDMTGDFRKIDRLMDYGIFTLISHPMNWLLNLFHGWFGNWGWAIVAMTFVVRLLIWPLYRKSYHSMKRMSLLQPKMKELKEKYPNNQQKVSMEMMKLYREYGISPMGGCLPMLLQMPIFLSFFYVLQTAEEFRSEGFIAWVHDLSQMDTVCVIPIFGWEFPVNILPITMVSLMWLQMRMTPQTISDPMQRRIMQIMPLFFFAFCYFYQSSLALYWTVTNIISIFQTWLIRRLPEPTLEPVVKQKGGKKSFMERMMEAQQRALAEQQRQHKQGGMRNVTPRKK